MMFAEVIWFGLIPMFQSIRHSRKCGCCGRRHYVVGAKARFGGFPRGWYWECRCGSTMFSSG